MAQSSDEELRRLRRRRLAQGFLLGGAAVGIPALVNSWVARRARGLPDATWGSGDHYRRSQADIAYQRLGEGPPLVLLHSFGPGHSSAEWRSAAEQLAPSFEVFALDLPGWGQSSAFDTPLDHDLNTSLVKDFLRDVVRVDPLKRRVTLVAAGLSAAYAVQVASELPEAITALALVAPMGIDDDSFDLRDAMIHRLLRLPVLGRSAVNVFTSRSNVAAYLRRDVFSAPELVDEATIDQHYFNSHRPGSQEALTAYVSGDLHRGVRDLLAQLELPVWIAWGRRALSPSVEQADLWLSRLPQAELEIFEHAGMLPHAESPGEFSRKLESFLNDTGSDQAKADGSDPPADGGGDPES